MTINLESYGSIHFNGNSVNTGFPARFHVDGLFNGGGFKLTFHQGTYIVKDLVADRLYMLILPLVKAESMLSEWLALNPDCVFVGSFEDITQIAEKVHDH